MGKCWETGGKMKWENIGKYIEIHRNRRGCETGRYIEIRGNTLEIKAGNILLGIFVLFV